jgi:hypothetical protein
MEFVFDVVVVVEFVFDVVSVENETNEKNDSEIVVGVNETGGTNKIEGAANYYLMNDETVDGIEDKVHETAVETVGDRIENKTETENKNYLANGLKYLN